MNAETAMQIHRRQMFLHAGELADDGRRQSVGVVLFVGGTVLGLVANLV